MPSPRPTEHPYDATFENEHGERWAVYEEKGRLYFTCSDLDWTPHDCTDAPIGGSAFIEAAGSHTFCHVVVSFEEWAFLSACLSCWRTRQNWAAAT